MQQENSHPDTSRETDYRPTRYGSTDIDRNNEIHDGDKNRHMPTQHQDKSPYKNLLWMGIIHVPVMYVIMFSMVDTAEDIYQNLNTFYMALMMAAPMVAIMPFMMKEMYPDKKKNFLVVLGSVAIIAAAFLATRVQTAIGDKQFIRSMIPHHSGAILMCNEASIVDPELKSLCGKISSGQREEIEQMENIIERLK